MPVIVRNLDLQMVIVAIQWPVLWPRASLNGHPLAGGPAYRMVDERGLVSSSVLGEHKAAQQEERERELLWGSAGFW